MASIVLNWADNSNNEDGFHVYRGVNGAEKTLLADTARDIVTFTDADVTPGTYQYAVSSFNGIGESARVDSNSIEVLSIDVPSAPSDVVATLVA